MANEDKNFIKLTDRTPEEAHAIRSKGGKARAKKAREQKTFKELFAVIMNEKSTNGKETYKELIAKATIKEALKGKIPAIELCMNVIGENPKENTENGQTNITFSFDYKEQE